MHYLITDMDEESIQFHGPIWTVKRDFRLKDDNDVTEICRYCKFMLSIKPASIYTFRFQLTLLDRGIWKLRLCLDPRQAYYYSGHSKEKERIKKSDFQGFSDMIKDNPVVFNPYSDGKYMRSFFSEESRKEVAKQERVIETCTKKKESGSVCGFKVYEGSVFPECVFSDKYFHLMFPRSLLSEMFLVPRGMLHTSEEMVISPVFWKTVAKCHRSLTAFALDDHDCSPPRPAFNHVLVNFGLWRTEATHDGYMQGCHAHAQLITRNVMIHGRRNHTAFDHFSTEYESFDKDVLFHRNLSDALSACNRSNDILNKIKEQMDVLCKIYAEK